MQAQGAVTLCSRSAPAGGSGRGLLHEHGHAPPQPRPRLLPRTRRRKTTCVRVSLTKFSCCDMHAWCARARAPLELSAPAPLRQECVAQASANGATPAGGASVLQAPAAPDTAGLVFSPGEPGAWDDACVGNPVVRACSPAAPCTPAPLPSAPCSRSSARLPCAGRVGGC